MNGGDDPGIPVEVVGVEVLPQNLVIRADETWEGRLPSGGDQFSYQELTEAVGGGFIQLVTLADGRLLICDDDGHRKRPPSSGEDH